MVEGTRIRDVGPNVAIPPGARVIDLSGMTVMPGPRRSAQPPGADLQAVSGKQHLLLHLRAGIDGAARDPGGVERDPDARVGIHDRPRHGQQRATTPTRRCGRRSIRDGFPGPTIINSGIIIGGMGGQFFPTPEMFKDHNIVYPEYLDADTPDEIVKAIRQNILFGAQGDQDLRRLQAVRLHRRRDPARDPRGGEVGHEGRRPRADAERRAQCDRGRHLVDRALRRAHR